VRDGQWQPEVPYLNTASVGLPPRVAWDALQTALENWRAGRGVWEEWSESTTRARSSFARLLGVDESAVAVGATAAELVGLVAGAVPAGSRVLTAEGDFTSILYPWVAQGHDVRAVPLGAIADAVDADTDVVAVSAVQSSNGALADLAGIKQAAADAGALVVVDATQACGWLPLDLSLYDAAVCGGYKWLMGPRGTAFLTVGERLVDRVTPLHASWFAAEDVHGSYYGLPMRLASSARRLDTSPAWFSWVGAAPALELIEEIGVEEIRDHDIGLANRFRAGLGLESSESAIVATDVPGARERLEAAGVRAATRAGSLRASFHVYNTEADVDAALEALRSD
jgi:selenocysteine lyase/cysteine desulfurase